MTLEEKRIRYEKSVKRAKKFALNAVIVLVAVAASGMFIGYLTEGLQAAAAEATYEDVRGDIVESGSHEINFTVVQERGSTSTSWIYLPDTDIDYPMVQGPDNDMYLDVDAYGKGIQVILAALGDRFFITIDQDWSEKVYTDSFFSVLRERNISYEINYDGILELPEMNLKNRA